jgi:fructosamine-3-kinase
MPLWTTIAESISQSTGRPVVFDEHQTVGSGCINESHVLVGRDGRRYFVKLNDAGYRTMFEAEADGLREILASRAITAPEPICNGVSGGRAYLVLEWLDLGKHACDDEQLGIQLAAMHGHQQTRFGWRRDNTIGTTPQINSSTHDWVEFWRQHRLGFQLTLAADQGYAGALARKGEKLMENLDCFFEDYSPAASLLHGDLWAGNYGAIAGGRPVVFDPAVYYGDRETDIAMTELFGGFSPRFYAAYNSVLPLDQGYATRKTLYNLYHILNHLHLFGGGYRGQAERMIDQLLRSIH